MKHFAGQEIGQHVLIHSENIAIVAYISCQDKLPLKAMCQLASQILLWAHSRLLLLSPCQRSVSSCKQVLSPTGCREHLGPIWKGTSRHTSAVVFYSERQHPQGFGSLLAKEPALCIPQLSITFPCYSTSWTM